MKRYLGIQESAVLVTVSLDLGSLSYVVADQWDSPSKAGHGVYFAGMDTHISMKPILPPIPASGEIRCDLVV